MGDLDRMTDGSYWYVANVVDRFYPAYIGMYGDEPSHTYWFWHSFVSVEGRIEVDNVDVTVMYQMGDINRDWEGVHFVSTASLKDYDQQMLPITLSNAGWNSSTPETPGSRSCQLDHYHDYYPKPCSSFHGIYYEQYGRFTIWRQTPTDEDDEGNTLYRFEKDRYLRGK